MIVMIFEYWLNEDHLDDYIQHATTLRQLVNEVDGFISIERYTSTSDPKKILVLGFFRDEEAVGAWRNIAEHRQAQLLGRQLFFTDYRLRMADVSRDYGMKDREQVPEDSRSIHDNHNIIRGETHV